MFIYTIIIIYIYNRLIRDSGFKTSKIIIGSNCWIGSNVTILMNAKIGNNVVIGAGCIINSDIPSNSIVINKQNLVIKSIELC